MRTLNTLEVVAAVLLTVVKPLMTLAAVLFGWWLRGRRQKS